MEPPFERYPTTAARQTLATRLQLPYSDAMQDWEWEVADANRFTEFIDVYCSGSLGEDEMCSLMEILVQCVENLLQDAGDQSDAILAWLNLRPFLLQRSDLHLSTITYWACLPEAEQGMQFAISSHMRELLPAVGR